jgi:hypothetical protein
MVTWPRVRREEKREKKEKSVGKERAQEQGTEDG